MINELEHISKVQDLMDIYEFLQDDDFAEAMDTALRCIVKPDVPPQMAANLVLQMQGYATKFRMEAVKYTYLEVGKAGTEPNKKKNIYFAVSECCDKLAAAAKYLAKD